MFHKKKVDPKEAARCAFRTSHRSSSQLVLCIEASCCEIYYTWVLIANPSFNFALTAAKLLSEFFICYILLVDISSLSSKQLRVY
jgi:hypothetical protein